MKFQVEKKDHFTGHKDSVYTLIKGLEKDVFYSASGDGLVVEWNLANPDLGKPVANVANSVYSIYLDEARNEIWIGHNYEGVHVGDPIQRKSLASIALSKEAIFAISGFKNDIFIGSGDGVVTIIDKESRAFRKHIKASEKSVRAIAVNPVEMDFAVGYSDNNIRIFDLNTYELKQVIPAHTNSVFGLKYSPDFQSLYSVSRDARLKKWDVIKKYELDNEAVAHMYTINDVAFSPNGQYFATCSMDKSIKLWETANFKLRKVLDQARFASHGTSINKLLWLSDEDLLACSDDRTISHWKVSPIFN